MLCHDTQMYTSLCFSLQLWFRYTMTRIFLWGRVPFIPRCPIWQGLWLLWSTHLQFPSGKLGLKTNLSMWINGCGWNLPQVIEECLVISLLGNNPSYHLVGTLYFRSALQISINPQVPVHPVIGHSHQELNINSLILEARAFPGRASSTSLPSRASSASLPPPFTAREGRLLQY